MKKLGLMGVVLMSGAAFAADGIKLGGFADVGFTFSNATDPATKSFGVGDGAFYFGKTMGMGEVLVDIPFFYSTATGPNGILAGARQAQAWISWKYENGAWWKMGQFDSLFGYEANDSWDRTFSKAGLVSGTVPVTHTGLNVGYKASDNLNIGLLISDPHDKGAMAAGGKFDFGGKIETSSDAFNASVGFLMSYGTSAYGYLVDVIAGSKMGQLNANVEFNMGNNKIVDKSYMGFGAYLDYTMSEMTEIGAALDWTKDAASAKNMELRVGPKFNMNKDFNVRIALDWTQHAPVDSSVGVMLNAVHRF